MMNVGETYYLLEEIGAYAAPGIVWGRIGDQVTIISNCDYVMIVEGADKERFPVSITKLSNDKVQANAQHSTVSGMDVLEKGANTKLRRQKRSCVSSGNMHINEYSLFQNS